MTDGERLHRHAAHRVTDEHDVAQVELLEHGAQVVGEVVERVAGVARPRLAVSTRVEGDRTEPGRRERLELLGPDPRRERDAVAEHDDRAVTAADRVDGAAVVAVEDAGVVEHRHQRLAGVGIVAVPQASHQRALGRVREADRAGGGAGDEAGALQRLRCHRPQRGRSPT